MGAVPFLAAFLVVIVAALRVVVTFSPNLYWATDPREDSLPVMGFGPTGAVVTDWLAVVALALAVMDCVLRGRRVHTVLLGLWAVGLGFAAYQGSIDYDSLRLGGDWAGAIALGLAAMHLGSDERWRRVLLAAVVALIIPLGVQGLRQVTVEHAETVEDYRAHREERLRQRGWEVGSSEQRKFEARLEQNEATGRIGLSNVFASVMVALTLVGGGVAASFWRRSVAKPRAAAVGAIMLIGLVTLAVTFSKGAIMAMAATLFVLLPIGYLLRSHDRKSEIGNRKSWAFGVTVLLIVAAGIGGVVARGMMGEPATPKGERSLLFRYHYWQAAARMVEEQPVVGVGPGRFQDSYLIHKNPKNPEEVSDPHNVFVAFISTLGIGGWAWSLVLLAMLWRAGRGQGSGARSQRPEVGKSIFVVSSLIVFTTEFAATWTMLGEKAGVMLASVSLVFMAMGCLAWAGKVKDKKGVRVFYDKELGVILIGAGLVGPVHFLPVLAAWLWGAVGFVVAAHWLAKHADFDSPIARLGLLAAAAAMLLHAQIEMSVTNTMAGPVLLVVLGLAAGGSLRQGSGVRGQESEQTINRPKKLPVVAGAIFALLCVLGFPALFQGVVEGFATHAAVLSIRNGNIEEALDKWLPALRQFRPARLHAVRYEAQYWLELDTPYKGLDVFEEAREKGIHLAMLWRAEASLAEEAHRRTKDKKYLDRAAAAAVEALKYDPYSIDGHIHAGDLSAAMGRGEEAKKYYLRALELNELAYLDPNKQLSEKERAEVEKKLQIAK